MFLSLSEYCFECLIMFKCFIHSVRHENYFEVIKCGCSFNWFLTTLLWCFIIYSIYWVMYKPINWSRDVTEIGYIVHNGDKSRLKKETINRIRRLRKVGADLPPPYPNGWFALLRSEQLKRGKSINIDCLGENFAVFRSESGTAYVLDAYCPHLGANIGAGGHVKGECIECPFHNWSFRGSDGVCVGMPHVENYNKDVKIKSWKSCEKLGRVFVWYHAEGKEPSWIVPEFEEVTSGKYVYHGGSEIWINCHAQDFSENGADAYHLNNLHRWNIFTGNNIANGQNRWGKFANHAWDLKWYPSKEANESHICNIEIKHKYQMFNKISVGKTTIFGVQYGPGIVIVRVPSPFGTVCVLQTSTTYEPFMLKIDQMFFGPKFRGFYMKIFALAEQIMIERDIAIWNSKTYLKSPHYVKEDIHLKQFRRWYSQFYTSNSVTYNMIKETTSW